MDLVSLSPALLVSLLQSSRPKVTKNSNILKKSTIAEITGMTDTESEMRWLLVWRNVKVGDEWGNKPLYAICPKVDVTIGGKLAPYRTVRQIW